MFFKENFGICPPPQGRQILVCGAGKVLHIEFLCVLVMVCVGDCFFYVLFC